MQVYALTSSQSVHETLDLFLTREAAEAELREILEDEPDWKDVLRVVPIELDERNVFGELGRSLSRIRSSDLAKPHVGESAGVLHVVAESDAQSL
jgi:hypothetical protein